MANAILKRIKILDFYAKPITFTYKGNESFRSVLGGIISLVIIVILTVIFGYKIERLMSRDDTTTRKSSIYRLSNELSPPEVVG